MTTKLWGTIETLFKCEEPFQKLENGNGFVGVVLRDSKVDKIQCHECGGWYMSLLAHVNRNHKMNQRNYRIKYQLPLSFPLVGLKRSQRLSEIAHDNYGIHHMRNMSMKAKESNKRKENIEAFRKAQAYARNNRSFQNKHGLCPDQINRRFSIVRDQLRGKEPSKSDLMKYDAKLCDAIERRFGSLNEYRRKNGHAIIPRHALITHDKIISALRKFAIEHNRPPTVRDFRVRGVSPSDFTIRRQFGSFRRALGAAGLGEVGERFKPTVLKTVSGLNGHSRVRISPSPKCATATQRI